MKAKYFSIVIVIFLFATSCKISPEAKFEVTLKDNAAFVNDTIKFINQSTGAKFYHWDFGDSTFSNEKNPTHIYKHVNLCNVILTASSSNNSNRLVSRYQETILVTPPIYSIATINSIRIMIFQKPDATHDWDSDVYHSDSIQARPDIYVAYFEAGGPPPPNWIDDFRNTHLDNKKPLPPSVYSFSPALVITDFEKKFMFELMDYDPSIAGDMNGRDDQISNHCLLDLKPDFDQQWYRDTIAIPDSANKVTLEFHIQWSN